jgi:CBS domain-containing protein
MLKSSMDSILTVEELLRTKGHEIWSISPQETVYRALEIMAEKGVGALIVVDYEEVVGIFSERDYARKVILRGKSSRETAVSELMTRTVFYVTPNTTLKESMAFMVSKHIRHLPVLDNGRLIGVITLGDVIKKIIADQEHAINLLEGYIIS